MQHLTGVDTKTAALTMLGPYVLWLATVGRYLWQQVGHLI